MSRQPNNPSTLPDHEITSTRLVTRPQHYKTNIHFEEPIDEGSFERYTRGAQTKTRYRLNFVLLQPEILLTIYKTDQVILHRLHLQKQ